MKKNILIATIALASIGGLIAEDKPKVAIGNSEASQAVENPVQQALSETRKKLSDLAHHDAFVLKQFDQFADVLQTAYQKEKSMTAVEIQEICRGLVFASEKHRLQTRKNKEKTPYISHPIAVAYNLMQVGEVREQSTIIGALLHDTLEDTQTTFEEIEGKFGKQVASLVREVADDKSVAKETRSRLQVITASHKSKAAAQITLADNLFNLNDLFHNAPADWSQSRIDRYYEWSQSVIDRLPPANSKLNDAAQDVINTYWEKQAASKK